MLAQTDGVIVVPIFPAFSPAAIADLLTRFSPKPVGRSTVHYWLQEGKLESYRDNVDDPYVLRGELIRFIKDYLKRPFRA